MTTALLLSIALGVAAILVVRGVAQWLTTWYIDTWVR